MQSASRNADIGLVSYRVLPAVFTKSIARSAAEGVQNSSILVTPLSIQSCLGGTYQTGSPTPQLDELIAMTGSTLFFVCDNSILNFIKCAPVQPQTAAGKMDQIQHHAQITEILKSLCKLFVK